MNLKHLVSIRSLSREQILDLLDEGIRMILFALQNRIVPGVFRLEHDTQQNPGFCTITYEPSTGTRVSFDAAATLTGCSYPTAAITEIMNTSGKKGEPVYHLVRRLYLEAGIRFFAIRHKLAGLARALAYEFDRDHSGHTMLGNDISFLCAGEGEEYHPSQVILDWLAIVAFKLFKEAIERDGQSRSRHDNLVAAVNAFSVRKEAERLEMIADCIDGERICFGGDLTKSRVLADHLSMGEEGKFDLRFVLVAPHFAKVQGFRLQRVQHTTTTEWHPDLDANWFFRIRWQKERWPEAFHPQIEECDEAFRVNRQFMDRLMSRPEPGYVMDVLPIDKVNPSITQDVEDHPHVLAWFEAAMALPARMAIIKLAYSHWCDEEAAAKYSWRLPDPILASLVNARDPVCLSEYHARTLADSDERVNRLKTGCSLDHLPPNQSLLLYRLLKWLGYPGQIILTPNVFPKDRPMALKDMKWFPDQPLHEWNPSILDAIDFLMESRQTYNHFAADQDLFFKLALARPDGGSRVVGILPCPRGAGHCIDGYHEEVRVRSIATIYGSGKGALLTCEYCGGVFTPQQVRDRLNAVLPAA